jgi:hypothetical protein
MSSVMSLGAAVLIFPWPKQLFPHAHIILGFSYMIIELA